MPVHFVVSIELGGLADSEAEFLYFGSLSDLGGAFIVDFFVDFQVLVTAAQVSSERRAASTA